MFTLTELVSLGEWRGGPGGGRLLKPWWDVFMEHLLVLLLCVSLLSSTLLLSRDQVVCLPCDPPTRHNHSKSRPQPLAGSPDPHTTTPSAQPPAPTMPPPPPIGRRTHLDYQQYLYVSQVCYHSALPWHSRYFPYLALLHSLLLLAGGSVWLRYPKTAARLEHFSVILGKCFESPWTSRALSHTAWQDSEADTEAETGTGREGAGETGRAREGEAGSGPSLSSSTCSLSSSLSSSPSLSLSRAGGPSLDLGTDSPLLTRPATAAASSFVCPPPQSSCSSSLSSLSPPPRVAAPPPPPRLERSDGEQARALFERVRRFRAHSEGGDIVYKVYVAQTVFKLVHCAVILCYTTPLLGSLSFSHECRAPHTEHSAPLLHALTGYSTFLCAHEFGTTLRKLQLVYLTLVCVYGLLALYTLGWICSRPLRRYSFARLREENALVCDVPDVTNDFAFLLHLADQSDPLPPRRIATFLSHRSETRLLARGGAGGAERLRGLTFRDPQGRPTLHLCALPCLPPALFAQQHLQVLKLELIPRARLSAPLRQLISLRELHLYDCCPLLDPAGLAVLQERLEVLHLRVSETAQVPGWVCRLGGLRELHLSGGGLFAEAGGGRGRGLALGPLGGLRRLRVLSLRCSLRRIPGELGELGGSLVRLEVHNDGARLVALGGLRRLGGGGLAELVLRSCELESLPAPVLSLQALQNLDLACNALRSPEELLGLSRLPRLASLHLAHNRLPRLPPGLALLRALERLDLSHNQLEAVPPALLALPRLRCLDLSHNRLGELGAELGLGGAMAELDLSHNHLESLPPHLLCGCPCLRSLLLGWNALSALPPGLPALPLLARLDVRGNCLEALPASLALCPSLRKPGLLAEDWLMRSLPPATRDALLRPLTTAPTMPPLCPPTLPSLLPSPETPRPPDAPIPDSPPPTPTPTPTAAQLLSFWALESQI
ncbi:volume-regulated anion channel subunit LRRC8D [Amia ocellicauda]|uniref:volume-regulated anion channel subunit LRRC8D n=1 Tax=Amia ocellicauda TaxID=2972642 RepID=UPI003463A442